MKKLINILDEKDIRYFDSDMNPSDWIDVSKYREMTKKEILMIETEKENEFCIFWDGKGWIDPRTDEEKQIYARENMEDLTRYQLKSALVQKGFKIDEVKALIIENPDETARDLALIALDDADKFRRLGGAVLTIQEALKKDDSAMDDFWSYALTF